jgi:orotidine-5'-phosphate decarboxylase
VIYEAKLVTAKDRFVNAFARKLHSAGQRNDSLLCVGLDPDLTRIPRHLASLEPREAIVRFNEAIIAATSDLVCAFKPNLGFYLAYGIPGLEALVASRALIPAEIPVILDGKFGDVGGTTEAYGIGFFDQWDFDALTASPYVGWDGLEPLFRRRDRGVFILCKTSNPSSGDFQDRVVVGEDASRPLYRLVARSVTAWEKRSQAALGLVVGATYPDELAAVRTDCPGLPILIPGIGAQRGDVRAAIESGLDSDGRGVLISASRSVLYAGADAHFAESAREQALDLRHRINEARESVLAMRRETTQHAGARTPEAGTNGP